MNAKILTALVGIAALAIPAAVPASQPSAVRLDALAAKVTVVPGTTNLVTLLADPRQAAELTVVLPQGHDTLNWIDSDPFAL